MAIKPKDLTTAQRGIDKLEKLFKNYECLATDRKLSLYTSNGNIVDDLYHDDAQATVEIALDGLRLAIEARIDDLALLGVDVSAYWPRVPTVRNDALADVAETYNGHIEIRDKRIAAEAAKAETDNAVASFAAPVGG